MDAQAEAQTAARYISSSVPEIKVEQSDPMDDINCQYFQANRSQGSHYRFSEFSSHSQRGESSKSQSQRVPNYQVDEFHSQMPTKYPATLQQKSNQQSILTQDPAKTSKNSNLSLRFRQLMSVILTQLGEDKVLQLRSLCIKLRRNEVSKEEFLPLMKEIIGEQIMKKSLYQLGTQTVELLQSWTASVQEPATASINLREGAEAQIPYRAPQIKIESSDPVADINVKIPYRARQIKVESSDPVADISEKIPYRAPQIEVESSDPVANISEKIRYRAPQIKVESSDPVADTNEMIYQVDKSQRVNYRSQNLTIRSHRGPDDQVTKSRHRVTSQSSGNLKQTSNQQLAAAQADMYCHIPSSAPEVKAYSTNPIADINCQNSRGIQNLVAQSQRVQSFPIQSQRVQNFPIQSLRVQNYHRSEYQNPIAGINSQKSQGIQNLVAQSQRVQNCPIQSQRVPNYHRSEYQNPIVSINCQNSQGLQNLVAQSKRVQNFPIQSQRVPNYLCSEYQNPIAGINCQNSQGIQNLVAQSQRVPNYQCSEYQNPIANQNPTTLQQEFHQQTISTRKTTVKLEEQEFHQQTISTQKTAVKLEEEEFHQQTISTQNPTDKSQELNVSFKHLFSMIAPQLDMDKTLQLQTLLIKLMRHEVSKQSFLRLMKEIVGEPIIRMVLYQLQAQAQGQAGVSHIPSSAQEVKVESSDPVSDINSQNFRGAYLSQGLHNLGIQPQRVQNSSSQSQRVPNYQFSESHSPNANQKMENLQQTSHQHTISNQHTATKSETPKQVSLAKLIPLILPQLDMVKAMKLQDLFNKYKRNEVSKERFPRLMKEIVHRTIIETTIYQLLAQAKAEGESSKIPQLSSQLCRKPVISKLTMSTPTAVNTSIKDEEVNVGQLTPMKIPKLNEDKNMKLETFRASLAAQKLQIGTSNSAIKLEIPGSSAGDKTSMV